MTRPRDTQRSKAYKAENEFWKTWLGTPVQLTQDEVLHEVERLAAELRLPMPSVRWGRRNARTARGGVSKSGKPYIVLPRGLRTVPLILHELAHAWLELDAPNRYAWHSAEWVRTYLLLVDIRYGEDFSVNLLTSFTQHGVSHNIKESA